jgi:glycosyltransferase involved in cell wall biosynthesis
MTHYPRVALTYIAGEVDGIERNGGLIFPIVMNAPDRADLTTDGARDRARKSLFLKASPWRLLTAALAAFAAHPFRMSRLTGTAIRSARLDLGLTARRLVHLCYATVAARHCRANQIHHLHAQFGLAPATIAWFATDILNFGTHRRCTWSFTIHGFQDFIDENVARLDLKAASAAFVVCVSDFTKSQLCRVTDPVYWDRFHVVRCGIDLSAFPLREPHRLRSVPRIVVVGRLSPEKGHGIVLDAVRKLLDAGVEVELEIIGDGEFGVAIRRQEKALGLTGRVIHAGELQPPEVAGRLAEADIFCMASFAEGLPISIMEAMAVGVPVVSTWIGGIPELAVDGETALTVPPGNSDALAAAFKRLIAEPQLAARLVEGGRLAVEKMHSRAPNAGQLMSLFGSVNQVQALP